MFALTETEYQFRKKKRTDPDICFTFVLQEVILFTPWIPGLGLQNLLHYRYITFLGQFHSTFQRLLEATKF